MEIEDLVERFCTIAGMMMEDASVGAISMDRELEQRVRDLVKAGQAIDAVAVVAATLFETQSRPGSEPPPNDR